LKSVVSTIIQRNVIVTYYRLARTYEHGFTSDIVFVRGIDSTYSTDN